MCECHLLAEIIIGFVWLTSTCVLPQIFEGRQTRGQRAPIEFFNVILIGSPLCDSYFFPPLYLSLSSARLCVHAPWWYWILPKFLKKKYVVFFFFKEDPTSINYCSRGISSLKDARFLWRHLSGFSSLRTERTVSNSVSPKRNLQLV